MKVTKAIVYITGILIVALCIYGMFTYTSPWRFVCFPGLMFFGIFPPIFIAMAERGLKEEKHE